MRIGIVGGTGDFGQGLAERLVDGRAVDAGRLEVARWIEPLTAVLLNVNRRYRTNAGVRVTGVG